MVEILSGLFLIMADLWLYQMVNCSTTSPREYFSTRYWPGLYAQKYLDTMQRVPWQISKLGNSDSQKEHG